jgi:tRNA 2-thiouridine synthesizing protein A
MLAHDREVDARGLNCPLPILRTKKGIERHAVGAGRASFSPPILPACAISRRFARQTGNELVEHGERDGAFWFFVRRR